jgi:hypothetical protein
MLQKVVFERTLLPKGDTLSLSGFIAVVGVSFTWLRTKGYIKFCGQ